MEAQGLKANMVNCCAAFPAPGVLKFRLPCPTAAAPHLSDNFAISNLKRKHGIDQEKGNFMHTALDLDGAPHLVGVAAVGPYLVERGVTLVVVGIQLPVKHAFADIPTQQQQ